MIRNAICGRQQHTLRDETEAAHNPDNLFERRREPMDKWTKFATAEPANAMTIRA